MHINFIGSLQHLPWREVWEGFKGMSAVGGLIYGWINKRKIQEVHITMNSRLDELMKQHGQVKFNEGLEEGRKEVKE